MIYLKFQINVNPGLGFFQSTFLEAYFRGGFIFRVGLLLERVLGFKMDWA